MNKVLVSITICCLYFTGIASSHPDSLFKYGREAVKIHQYYEGLELLEQARDAYQAMANYEFVAYCNANMAQVYETIDNYEAAFEYNQKALALLLDINKPASLGKIWFNLGRVHFKQRLYLQSIAAFQKSIELSNEYVQAMAYNWLGINFRNLNHFDSALFFHQKSLSLNNELGQAAEIARNFSNIGKVHYLKGAFNTAIEYYLQSESIQLQSRDTLSLFKLYNRLGEAYKDSGDPRNALVYLLKGQQLNYNDGTEILRNRELIASTRQIINSQVVSPPTDLGIVPNQSRGVGWVIGLVLLLLIFIGIFIFRRKIFPGYA